MPIVCASCPEAFHGEDADLCLQHGIQTALGNAGDRVNDLDGKEWIPEWGAKVVMAVEAYTPCSDVTILHISGGERCRLEMARQPVLVRAIKNNFASLKVPLEVTVRQMKIEQFREEYPWSNETTQESWMLKSGAEVFYSGPSGRRLGGKPLEPGHEGLVDYVDPLAPQEARV